MVDISRNCAILHHSQLKYLMRDVHVKFNLKPIIIENFILKGETEGGDFWYMYYQISLQFGTTESLSLSG